MSLSVKSLNVKRGGKSLLDNVSIDFTPGRLHFLIGLNGSGKTTLLKCIAGAISSGDSVLLSSKQLAKMAARQRAQQIAWVPQHLVPYAQYTTREYVLMGRFPYLPALGTYTAQDRAIAERFMEELALAEFTDRPLSTLSGGELQRASLARALTQETSVLLLDEPDQSLDPPARDDLFGRLAMLAQAGKTIICTTHHLEALQNPHARILGIRAGKLIWDTAGGNLPDGLMEQVYGKGISS